MYRVSQSGQESEETHLSDTLVNYSNDAQVNVCGFACVRLDIAWFDLRTNGVDRTVQCFCSDESNVESQYCDQFFRPVVAAIQHAKLVLDISLSWYYELVVLFILDAVLLAVSHLTGFVVKLER